MEVGGQFIFSYFLHEGSTPTPHQTASWVSLKISLDVVKKKKIAGSETQLSQPRASHFTDQTTMTRL
jgi:hypothetical protein